VLAVSGKAVTNIKNSINNSDTKCIFKTVESFKLSCIDNNPEQIIIDESSMLCYIDVFYII